MPSSLLKKKSTVCPSDSDDDSELAFSSSEAGEGSTRHSYSPVGRKFVKSTPRSGVVVERNRTGNNIQPTTAKITTETRKKNNQPNAAVNGVKPVVRCTQPKLYAKKFCSILGAASVNNDIMDADDSDDSIIIVSNNLPAKKGPASLSRPSVASKASASPPVHARGAAAHLPAYVAVAASGTANSKRLSSSLTKTNLSISREQSNSTGNKRMNGFVAATSKPLTNNKKPLLSGPNLKIISKPPSFNCYGPQTPYYDTDGETSFIDDDDNNTKPVKKKFCSISVAPDEDDDDDQVFADDDDSGDDSDESSAFPSKAAKDSFIRSNFSTPTAIHHHVEPAAAANRLALHAKSLPSTPTRSISTPHDKVAVCSAFKLAVQARAKPQQQQNSASVVIVDSTTITSDIPKPQTCLHADTRYRKNSSTTTKGGFERPGQFRYYSCFETNDLPIIDDTAAEAPNINVTKDAEIDAADSRPATPPPSKPTTLLAELPFYPLHRSGSLYDFLERPQMKFELKTILNTIPPPSLRAWRTNERDELVALGRTFSTPDKREKRVICYICGNAGSPQRPHPPSECPQLMCALCFRPGHVYNVCPYSKHLSATKCSSCDQMGHTHLWCNLHWRQHLFTKPPSTLVNADPPPAPPAPPSFSKRNSNNPVQDPQYYSVHFPHCYNCASAKHYGHQCGSTRRRDSERVATPHFPPVPVVPGSSDISRSNSGVMQKVKQLPFFRAKQEQQEIVTVVAGSSRSQSSTTCSSISTTSTTAIQQDLSMPGRERFQHFHTYLRTNVKSSSSSGNKRLDVDDDDAEAVVHSSKLEFLDKLPEVMRRRPYFNRRRGPPRPRSRQFRTDSPQRGRRFYNSGGDDNYGHHNMSTCGDFRGRNKQYQQSPSSYTKKRKSSGFMDFKSVPHDYGNNSNNNNKRRRIQRVPKQ